MSWFSLAFFGHDLGGLGTNFRGLKYDSLLNTEGLFQLVKPDAKAVTEFFRPGLLLIHQSGRAQCKTRLTVLQVSLRIGHQLTWDAAPRLEL